MKDPVSGKDYSEDDVKRAAEKNDSEYNTLLEQLKRGSVALLEDGTIIRRGYTTGTCAAAAAKAAVLPLTGKEVKEVNITTPVEVNVDIDVEPVKNDSACVRVDSGDFKDDVFNGLLIGARARRFPAFSIRAGKGIGIIKNAWLGKVGTPDIYPHVARNIEANVKDVLSGVEIEISVPKGEEIAKYTNLPLMGIEGGIPIFGDTGFTDPYAQRSYKNVIDFLVADKEEIIGVSTDEKSKRYAVEKLNFPANDIVVAGNLTCYAIGKSKAQKKAIFTTATKICDISEIDLPPHFDCEFSSMDELVERLKINGTEQLKMFFQTLAEEVARKTNADVYVFDDSGDIPGCFIRSSDSEDA
jgi:cobalt-precorrin-5B (C1)-methyltransferase